MQDRLMKHRIQLLSAFVLALPTAAMAQETTFEGDPTAPESEILMERSEGDARLPELELRARVHAGWMMEHLSDIRNTEDEARNENTFFVRRARFKGIWRPAEWVMALIQFDASAAIEIERSPLKDAYVHLAPLEQLELRVGQFKKPFSGLELRSSGRLKVIERGVGNDLLVDDNGLLYGDRDIGAQLSGRLVKAIKLDYAIGVFNGTGPSLDDLGTTKDLVTRIRTRPVKQLRIGLSNSLKFFDEVFGARPEFAWAAGGDVQVQVFKVRLFAEAIAARNYYLTTSDEPIALDVVGILSYRYRTPMEFRFALEPVFKFEWLDSDLIVIEDEVLLYTGGLNVYLGKYLRVMVDGEFQRSARNAKDLGYRDEERFMVLLCLDL
jgi:hypothetical protein